MTFPYGEWILFILIMVSWAEKHPAYRLFRSLGLAWLAGKVLEGYFDLFVPWHWEFARLAVMVVFWRWTWVRAQKRLFPFLLLSFGLLAEDLFMVNEPGILSHEQWIFNSLLLCLAWFATRTFWELAAAATGALLVNQGLIPFFYSGLISHADLPDPFSWHFWISAFSIMGIFGYLKKRIKKAPALNRSDEKVLPEPLEPESGQNQ